MFNCAYALEHLEAAFYTKALATPYQGMSSYEHSVLRDIKGHEIADREFLKKALGCNRIPDLTPNFSAVDFGSRDSVLKTASSFEDVSIVGSIRPRPG